MIIYRIVNKVNGKVYIGQTIMPLIRRWRVHKSSKRRSPLTNAFAKHGFENFTIEEIARATSLLELDILEQMFIVSHNCIAPRGYNLAYGGHSSRGCPAWNKGLKGLKAPKSAFKSGCIAWNKGKSPSTATRLKQSLAKRGVHNGLKTEFKKGAPSAFKGKRHSKEALERITTKNRLRATQIKCLETGETFSSIRQAAEKYDIAKSHLKRLVEAGKKHHGLQLTFVVFKLKS